ncbi:autotransporter assembly complex protein TamA [Mailhella sp.]
MKSARRIFFFCFGILLLSCLLSGCGLIREQSHTKRPHHAQFIETEPLSYDVEIKVEDVPAGQDAKAIRTGMEASSQLIQLKSRLPDGVLGLMHRANADRDTAEKLLRSLGYYDGHADTEVIEPVEEGGKAHVVLTLFAGALYSIGRTELLFQPALLELPETPGRFRSPLPKSVKGIEKGQPALARSVLDAVDKLPEEFHKAGYPWARIASTRNILDKASKTLDVEVTVDAGTPVLMGDVVVKGDSAVSPEYIKKLNTWRKGAVWSSGRISHYRERLQKQGLFRSVDIKPAPLSEAVIKEGEVHAELPVIVEVRDANFRTFGASTRYSTDNGIGIQGEWEHRNLFGAGEKLTLKAPFAQDKRGIQADFEKPCFLDRGQKLLAGGSVLEEETDAYDTKAQNAYIGLERRLSLRWWASVKLFAETGTVTRDYDEDYNYTSLIMGLRRDGRNHFMNPTKGTKLEFEVAPTTGDYEGRFSGFSARFTLTGYWSPFEADWLVLAGQYSAGSFFGVDLGNIPPPLRFYCGGGGSVRGYAYQAIGPENRWGDPEGGRSFQTVNLEARFRVTKEIGIVPFLDGGMVYSDEIPDFADDLQWAVGLGLRYYTSIGPVRFDVAVPLDKQDDDKGYQFYISIGQAF